MKASLAILILLLLQLPAMANPTTRKIHAQLMRTYCPSSLWSDELVETSWQQLGSYPRVKEIWRVLSSSPKSIEDTLNNSKDVTLNLDTRTYYLGWLYAGERGLKIANITPPEMSPNSAPNFKLAPRPLRLENGRLDYQGEPFDYLIAGSGPAGSVLASELAKTGASVVLLEQGALVVPGAMDTRLPPQLKFGGGAVPCQKSGIIIRNGMTVGGGSAVNVDLAFSPTLPFVMNRFQSWHDQGLIPATLWNDKQLETAYEWVEEKIGTRTPPRSEINQNNRVLETGAKLRDIHPRMYDLNTWAKMPDYKNKKSGFNRLLLNGLLDPKSHLSVIPNLHVERIVTRNGSATGAIVRATHPWKAPGVLLDPYYLGMLPKVRYFVPAKNVILSAGSQGTAAILLRSQLGGDMVGRGVVLHPSFPLVGAFNKDINAAYGTPSTIYAVDPEDEGLIYECMSGGPEYVAFMLFLSADEIYRQVKQYRKLAGFGFLLVDEVSLNNRVLLDENEQPVVAYSLSKVDKLRLARGVGESVKMMLAAGAKEVYVPSTECSVPIRTLQEADALVHTIKFKPGKTILTSAHMQSTCKMGTSPHNSVVNPDYQVWGVPNLYVCDSSIFPSSVGANPMQSIYTVAKILADKLTDRSEPSR